MLGSQAAWLLERYLMSQMQTLRQFLCSNEAIPFFILTIEHAGTCISRLDIGKGIGATSINAGYSYTFRIRSVID